MATDKLRVELELEATKAAREIAKLEKAAAKIGKSLSTGFGGGGGTDKVRALGTGLSKATVRADEFSKSLEASNARVIAFGASAGLIYQVDNALKAMVKSAIKVEKAMADVNIVMNLNNKQLQQFSKGMFKVAKETAQSFDTVAEATTEFARQGLSMENTLVRTKDALILTRLTGMKAADSVKSLTAAVNSFNKEGVNSTQIINRMAKVDAKFAVSSEDLAKSISRVGASAVSAGVSMNELMAITTAVQQRTARGGAVIGNAFKTIFTRIQRSDVQQRLENIGVATRDMQGQMLSGIKIVENLAKSFNGLSKAQQSSVSEQVAGVFQVNILKAAMADLASANSVYAGSLKAANTATDEAQRKNEKLNQTMDALVNKTLANLTSAGATLGEGMFGPAIQNVLGGINKLIESFGEGGKMESFGEGIGKNLLAGMGKFISGPGLIMAGVVFGKLAMKLGSFAKQAFQDIVGINQATKERAALEQGIVNILMKEPSLMTKVKSGASGILEVEKLILATIRAQNTARAQAQIAASTIAGGVMSRGRGAFGRTPGKAAGFVPNFANAGAERAAAAAGGYRAGAIRTMSQPGAGTMMYNSAETVKRFPGMSQSAIMPPANSAAGAGYKAAFGAAHGFNPYAAGGFVPNFARPMVAGAKGYRPKKGHTAKSRKAMEEAGGLITIGGGLEGGIAMLVPDGQPNALGGLVSGTGKYKNFKAQSPIRSYNQETLDRLAPTDIVGSISKAVANETMKYAMKINPPAREVTLPEVIGALDSTKGAKGALTAAAGAGFEVGMNLALDAEAAAEENKIGDFDLRGNQAAKTHPIFGGGYGIADYKASRSKGNRSSMVNKMAKELVENGPGAQFMFHTPNKKPGKALGFIPNFSPLGDAIGREVAAGVPASAIRIGSNASLKGPGNPAGVGVYNTIHEPGGLRQGVARSAAMGINPRAHGASSGFIPNYFWGAVGKKALGYAGTGLKQGAGMGIGMVGMNLMGQTSDDSGDWWKRVGAAGLAGAMGGPWGAVAGAGLQGLTEIISLLMDTSDEAAEALKREIEANEALLSASLGAADGFGKLAESLSTAEFMSKKIAVLGTLGIGTEAGGKTSAAHSMHGTPELAALEASDKTNFGAALGAFNKRLFQRTTFTKSLLPQAEFNALFQKDPAGIERGASLNRQGVRSGDSLNRWLSGRDSITGKGRPKDRTLLQSRYEIMQGTGERLANYNADDAIYAQFMRDRAGIASQKKMGIAGGVGATYADKLYKNLQTNNPAFSSAAVTQRLAAGGVSPWMMEKSILGGADIFESGLANPFSSFRKDASRSQKNDLIAALTGSTPEDVNKKLLGPAQKAIYAREDLTPEEQEQAFADVQNRLIEIFSNQAEYNKLIAEGNEGKRKENKETADFSETIRKAMLAQEGYRQEVLGSKRALATLTRNVAQEGAMFGLGASYRTAKAGATLTRRDAAGVAQRIAFGRAGITRRGKDRIADQALETDVKAGLKDLDVVKFIEGQKLGAGQAKMALQAFEGLRASASGGDRKSVDTYLNQLADVKGLKLRTGVFKGDLKGIEQQMAFQNLSKVIDVLTKAEEKHILAKDAARETEENAIALAKEKYRLDIETLKLAYKLNTARRQESREIEAALAQQELAEARGLVNTGQMGARGRNAAFSANLAKQVAGRGLQRGDFGTAFRAGFTNEFGYEGVDALQDFESGTRQVAQTMKSSFADAFQSIASGASTVQGALANMAQSILNSISSMSSQMFTNMMFAKMGMGGNQYANGGYVPGYNYGGLVTGGSGQKDDVITRMRGGEFVIKKSAVNKIGLPTLNAINGAPSFANGGPTMGQMGLVAAGASAASGLIGAAMQPGTPSPAPSQNYGYGRGSYGYFGGPDPDAGGADVVSGRGGAAGVSLRKAFVYYRRDPKTGQLISERARPTEGKFDVSSKLSLLGRLGADDPQTARMFDKEQKMAKYQDYLTTETQRRRDEINAVKRQKRGRLIGAYMNAAMLIGGAKWMDSAAVAAEQGQAYNAAFEQAKIPTHYNLEKFPLSERFATPGPETLGGLSATVGGDPRGGANGGIARVMGGEYIMSPSAVRTHGVNFMTELNRGNVPSFAAGGLFGNQPGPVINNGGSSLNTGGNTTNNVKVSVNIDKSGKASADTSATSQSGGPSEREESQEVENNKEFGKVLQNVVVQEIIKQQRPGGLLNKGTTGVG